MVHALRWQADCSIFVLIIKPNIKLFCSLEILESMTVKHVEAFGDSLLVVHLVFEKYQCLDGLLNTYLDKCIDIIARFDEFSIHHIYKHENSKAND
jgi:hypothetical protein